MDCTNEVLRPEQVDRIVVFRAFARWTAYMPTEELPPRMAMRFGGVGEDVIVAIVVRADRN